MRKYIKEECLFSPHQHGWLGNLGRRRKADGEGVGVCFLDSATRATKNRCQDQQKSVSLFTPKGILHLLQMSGPFVSLGTSFVSWCGRLGESARASVEVKTCTWELDEWGVVKTHGRNRIAQSQKIEVR